MGILDDAIRQHLDLKRRQGAEEDEIQRLEDEAFGPPSRPGDPEFGEPATQGETAQAVEAPPTPVSEPTPADPTPTQRERGEAEPGEPEAAEPEPTGGEPVEPETTVQGAEPEVMVDRAAEPPPTAEEPAVETQAHPQPEGETGEGPAFFDQSEHEAPPSTDEQMALDSTGEPISEPHEVPISSLDTVEHQFDDAAVETGEERAVEGGEEGVVETGEERAVEGEDEVEVELVEGELAEGERPETDQRSEEHEEEDDEDVLEETPEFLRDAPEDDELWFEQGEPKDFDF